MRVVLDFGERQHRCDAGVAAGKYALPFLARACGYDARKVLGQDRPALAIVLFGKRCRIKTQLADELGVEALLNGADREPLAIFGLVDIVPGRSAVDHVDAALVAPGSLREHS